MITELERRPCFADCLVGTTAKSRNHDDRSACPLVDRMGSRTKDPLVKAAPADGKLGCMNTNCQSSSAGIEIAATEGSLSSNIELTRFIERKRMGRNHSTQTK